MTNPNKSLWIILIFILIIINLFTGYQLIETTKSKSSIIADTTKKGIENRLLGNSKAELTIENFTLKGLLQKCQNQKEQLSLNNQENIEKWNNEEGYYPKTMQNKFHNGTKYTIQDANGNTEYRKVHGFIPSKTEFRTSESIGEIKKVSNQDPVKRKGDFDIKSSDND